MEDYILSKPKVNNAVICGWPETPKHGTRVNSLDYHRLSRNDKILHNSGILELFSWYIVYTNLNIDLKCHQSLAVLNLMNTPSSCYISMEYSLGPQPSSNFWSEALRIMTLACRFTDSVACWLAISDWQTLYKLHKLRLHYVIHPMHCIAMAQIHQIFLSYELFCQEDYSHQSNFGQL